MNTLALVISAASVTLAAATAIVLGLTLRDNRRRAAARVTALTRMAASEVELEPAIAEPDFLSEPEPLALSDPGRSTGAAALFTEPESRSPWAARLGIAAAVGVLGIAVLGIASLRSSSTDPGEGLAARPQPSPAPLELLALQHTQERDTLTVSGRVRNPAAGQPTAQLVATVFLFAPDGSFSGSGRVPLAQAVLAPGEAATFAVSVPVTGAVARYRVSFRDGAGRAVAHVDKRNGATVARMGDHQP